mmetsp:Transcript_41862/g.102625  ORF Transcript_41862/g.102625 Transcript_41862/m.102625 type:complete len:209 (+) Transcript_41862:183-809(+)
MRHWSRLLDCTCFRDTLCSERRSRRPYSDPPGMRCSSPPPPTPPRRGTSPHRTAAKGRPQQAHRPEPPAQPRPGGSGAEPPSRRPAVLSPARQTWEACGAACTALRDFSLYSRQPPGPPAAEADPPASRSRGAPARIRPDPAGAARQRAGEQGEVDGGALDPVSSGAPLGRLRRGRARGRRGGPPTSCCGGSARLRSQLGRTGRDPAG